MDWTTRTDDPLDIAVRDDVVRHLLAMRKPLLGSYRRYLVSEARNRRVLDIGICEHTPERMTSSAWKHGFIRSVATYTLGVDIIESLVADLRSKGINAVVCDATSDVDLGERFDLVHAGDVIEHVDSPVALLKFCKRHMMPGAKLIVRTPNAYCFEYVRLFSKYGTDRSNLEHVCYVTPTHALELGRRVGLRLSGYKVTYPRKLFPRGWFSIVKSLLRRKYGNAYAGLIGQPEVFSPIYVYEYTKD